MKFIETSIVTRQILELQPGTRHQPDRSHQILPSTLVLNPGCRQQLTAVNVNTALHTVKEYHVVKSVLRP